MARIIAPNKEYTGISASVFFYKGEGETEKPELIEWFKRHGYEVIKENKNPTDKSIDEMSVEELIEYANEKNIDIGKATSQNGIIEKIKAADKQGE